MAEAEESAPFERAELVSVIANACEGADLAVMITLSDVNPPKNLFLNSAAEKLLGCTAAEFQTKPVWDWITPEETTRVQAMREACLASGVAVPARPFETTIIGGAGQHIQVEVLQSRVQLKGRTLGVAFLFDISARKAADLALRQSEVEAAGLAARGVLSAAVAHELNNPLAYLLLNLEYLSRELPTLAQDSGKFTALMVCVKDACHGAERLASIVRDLKTFVRADEGARGSVDVRAGLEPAPSVRAARRGRILIVDDEISVARTLKALFQNEHDITLAASGKQALAAIEAEPGPDFDVIMCDLMMPGMTGMALFEHIKRARPGLEQRIVFMTGGVSVDRAREFLASSANPTFEKPFDFAQLRLALRRLVEGAQSRR